MNAKGGKNRASLCKKNIHFLNYINSLSTRQRKKVINLVSTKDEICSIFEIFINFLNNNINCKRKFIANIKRHENYFHKLVKKSNSLKQKKLLLTSKTGGFLMQTILALAVPLLTRLFSRK